MVKSKLVLVGICFVVFGVSIFAVGCGEGLKTESTVSIVQGTPSGLKIQGVVRKAKYTYNQWGYLELSTTQDPVEGVFVTLSGDSSKITQTATDGSYAFIDVAPGSHTIIVTKEGYQQRSANGSFITNPTSNTILTLDVNLIDNPKILKVELDKSTSPESVVVTFSEPMDTTTVIAAFSFDGMRAMGVSALGYVTTDKTWDSGKKVLTVKPHDNFVEGANYSVYLTGPDGYYKSIKGADGNYIDTSGLNINSSAIIITNFGTATSAPAPSAAPTNLKITINSTNEMDYPDINYYYDSFILSWDSVSGVTGYKVYCHVNNGPFQQYTYGSNSGGIYTTNAVIIRPDYVDNALADLTTNQYCPQEDALGKITWPFIVDYPIGFKVIAVNPNGESPASSILTVKDTVKPRLSSMSNSSLTIKYLYFNEPLDKSSAETSSNYLIAGQTITKAELTNNYYSSGSATVKLTLSPGVSTGTVTVDANVKDLTGNGVNPSYNSATF